MASSGTFNTNDKLEFNSLITIDLSKLEKVCGDMETIDKALNDIKDSISDTRRRIDDIWDGDAADAYVLQFARLNDDLKDFEDGFKDVKTLLQDTSNAFRSTDQELFRGMDEVAKKAESQTAEDADPIEDARPVPASTMEAEANAVLEEGKRKGIQELYSTMEAEKPAVLETYRRQPRPEFPALQEAAVEAVLESLRRGERGELYSTVEGVYNPRFDPSRRSERGEINSSVDPEQVAQLVELLRAMMEELLSVLPAERVAALIRAVMRAARQEMFTMLEAAVQAVLGTYSRATKQELFSTTPTPYNPIFEAVRRDMKSELYSTMETEYFAQFETTRRAYRPLPSTVLFFVAFVAVTEASRVQKGEGAAVTGAAEAAVLSENPRSAMRQVIGGVLQEDVGGQYLRPAMRNRMSDAVNTVIAEMPALLGENTVTGQKDVGFAQSVLQDYNAGSDKYRSVQRGILADKTTAVWIENAMNGANDQQLAQQLGQRVLKQIAPSSVNLDGEQGQAASQAVGQRMIDYTWNRVSYDAYRTAGGSASEITAAVMNENAAGSLPVT